MSTTRRRFLAASLGSSAIVSLTPRVPGFLLQAAAREQNKKQGENVLVVVQLSGGNDGLNTVVPYADDAYGRNRFTLRIGEGQVRKIDDYAGFHPAMEGFEKLLQQEKLAVLQGVGYENPNRSHFESMDIWHTARRKDQPRRVGWLGASLDAAVNAGPDVAAMHLGEGKQPLALASLKVNVPSIRSLQGFRLRGSEDRALVRTVEQALAAQRDANDDLLQFLHSSTSAALATSRRIQEVLGHGKTAVKYPQTKLAGKLRDVAQLIDADLGTRVYYVTLSGFDTHAEQNNAHAALLGELSGALAAFSEDLKSRGHDRHVLTLAFSEFGRRLRENASGGTDHGAAAPLFLIGSRVKPGLIGKHPSLTDLTSGDLKYHTDFRRVYATLLEKWLGWPSAEVLGKQYRPLDVLA
ncbi:MAG: DUF1501 domain-containing protein [Planctomycetes bacterium]|nr:DUF1501 domain-containing protein [Planctomycetota bacterium]